MAIKKIVLLFGMSFVLNSLCYSQNTFSEFDLNSENTVYLAFRKGRGSIDNNEGQKALSQSALNTSNGNQENIDSDKGARRFFTCIIIIAVLAVLILYFYLVKLRGVRNNSDNGLNLSSPESFVYRSELTDKLRVFNNKLDEFYKITVDLELKMKNLESEINNLRESKLNLANKKVTDSTILREQNKYISEKNTDKDKVETKGDNKEIKYLKGKSGNKFMFLADTKDDETFYCIEKHENIGKFEFCGNEDKAFGNFNAIFDNACDYEGDPRDAKKIINIEQGQVDLINEVWEVTKKAKIKVV